MRTLFAQSGPPSVRGTRATRSLAAAILLAAADAALADGINNTRFLHHFDVSNTDPVFSGKPGNADYAFGSPMIYTETPPFSNAPGGQIVNSPVKFGGGSLLRTDLATVGGRVEYDVENNFNLPRGTIDMWVNSSQLSTSNAFWGLWGTRSSVAPGDIRMYIYNTGGGRTLGAYMIGDDGVPNRWEIEQPIPVGLLTNNAWHHVAWEWDLSLGVSATYWDGHLLRDTASFGSVHYAGDLASQFITRFHIGENQGGSAPFPGYMDEFRISDVRRYNGVSFTPPTAPYSLTATPQWAIDNSGNWTSPGSWTAAVPNAVGATAVFGPIISTSRTVTLDAPITVGTLQFDSASRYTLQGSTLTVQTSSGNGVIALTQGSHIITAPLRLASDTTLSGPGTLKVASLAIDSGKSLDMTDRALVVDYTGGSPRATLEAQVGTGFNAGSQNGPGIRTSLGTSNRRLGIAEANETALFGSPFGGQTLDATTVLLRYTVTGDADLSGTTNIDDFGRLAANFNLPGRWALGDFDYSGTVNIDDFGLLAANFNQSLPAGAVGSRGVVPEPTVCGLLLLAGTAQARRRR